MSAANTTNSMVKIAHAEVFEIEAPFARPYGLSKAYGTMTTARAIVLKLTDADGVVGWGEANAMQPFTPESPQDVAKVLREQLLSATMLEPQPEPGRVDLLLDGIRDDHLRAKGAVSMALLDIQGKRLGVPVSTLLGGAVHSSLPVLWPLGTGTAEDDIKVIDERAPQGFSSFMLKMGDAPAQDEVRRVTTLEDRFGSKLKWIADANQGWSIAEARVFLAGIKDTGIAFVEQPLAAADREGMASLARESELPLSADESLLGLPEAATLARLGAASIFSIKSSKNGGPLRAQRIAAVAEAFGISCYMNSMLEFGITQAASLQHASTVRNLVDVGHAFMSTLRLADDPTDFSTFVKDGVVHLPDRSGLGVEVDDAHVRRMATAIHRLS